MDSQQNKTSGSKSMLAHSCYYKGFGRWCYIYKVERLDSAITGQHYCTFNHRVSQCRHVWGHELSDILPVGDLVTSFHRLRQFNICCGKYFKVSPYVIDPMLQSTWSGRSHTPSLLWHRKQNSIPHHTCLAPSEEQIRWLLPYFCMPNHMEDSHL